MFVALPVIADGRVAGVVYASRTPSNIVKYLYGERRNVLFAGLTVVAAALVVGFVFVRTISRPIRELIRRTEAIAQGDREALLPMSRHGTREIAQLSRSFFTMAKSLFDRSDFVATFAAHVSHELKSPLTSIQGAAELLRDAGGKMTDAERRRFLDNIIGDTDRLAKLLQRLRELAEADAPQRLGPTMLRQTIAGMVAAHPDLTITFNGDLDCAVDMAPENTAIVLLHLLDNARQHGAGSVMLMLRDEGHSIRVVVSDDGAGISLQNHDRVFDTFFTTRRDCGGTGMGLSIVRSMLTAHGGSIRLLPAKSGASFELLMPKAE